MIAWMIYALLVAAVLSGAALAAERAARVRRRVTRWVWFGALLGSLAMPVAMATVSFRVPDMLRTGVAPPPIVLRDTTSIAMPALLVHLDGDASFVAADHVAAWIRDGWAASSLAMLLMLLAGSVRLQRRKRGWVETSMCGERVLVAPDVGPAVAGLLRPRIVVPAWLLQTSTRQQRTVLAHERSHLDAGDTRLLAQALLLLLLMPWNPLMWWQLRRLRNAIEVDCDARVLRGGGHLGEYCETLIEVGERQVASLPLGPTMSAPCSFLEQRIKLMLMPPKRWAGVSAMLLVVASLGMTAFAAQVTPPGGAKAGGEQAVTLTSSALDRYTGFYKVSDISRVAVTRAGNGLVLDISAQAAAPKPLHAVPLGADRFAVLGQPAVVRFRMDDKGRADRLDILYKGRSALDVPRTSRAEAERIEAALRQRIQAQKPYPGSVKGLKLLLSDPVGGAGMSDGLAHARVVQRASREAYLAKLGPVQSYTFTGVNRFGDDVYLVRHAHGDEHMTLVVAPDGTVTRAFRYR